MVTPKSLVKSNQEQNRWGRSGFQILHSCKEKTWRHEWANVYRDAEVPPSSPKNTAPSVLSKLCTTSRLLSTRIMERAACGRQGSQGTAIATWYMAASIEWGSQVAPLEDKVSASTRLWRWFTDTQQCECDRVIGEMASWAIRDRVRTEIAAMNWLFKQFSIIYAFLPSGQSVLRPFLGWSGVLYQ